MKKIPCTFDAATGRYTHEPLPPDVIRVEFGTTEATIYQKGDTLPVSVPEVVANLITPRQFRQALSRLSAAMRQSFDTQFATLSQDDKDWWAFEKEYERTAPQVARLAAKMGVNSAQLDSLWAAAGKL